MIKTRGIDIEILFMEDLGSNIYGGAIYTLEKTIAEKRDLLKRFLQASVRGFWWARRSSVVVVCGACAK